MDNNRKKYKKIDYARNLCLGKHSLKKISAFLDMVYTFLWLILYNYIFVVKFLKLLFFILKYTRNLLPETAFLLPETAFLLPILNQV